MSKPQGWIYKLWFVETLPTKLNKTSKATRITANGEWRKFDPDIVVTPKEYIIIGSNVQTFNYEL